MTLGFRVGNILTDSWGAERLTIPYIKRTTETLTANQTSFTVGTSGDINIVRPVFITNIGYVDTSQDPDLEIPLRMITDDEYAAINFKTLTSTLPALAYYNPTYASSQGTLYPWPIPTSTTLLWAIYHPVAVPEWSATTSTLTIPPGYYRFIATNLAAELIPYFVSVPEEVARRVEIQAREAKAVIKVANWRPSDLGFDPGCLTGGTSHLSYARFLSGP